MSRFTFIASDYELPDIDLSGTMKLTVKDLKEYNLRIKSSVPDIQVNIEDVLCKFLISRT